MAVDDVHPVLSVEVVVNIWDAAAGVARVTVAAGIACAGALRVRVCVFALAAGFPGPVRLEDDGAVPPADSAILLAGEEGWWGIGGFLRELQAVGADGLKEGVCFVGEVVCCYCAVDGSERTGERPG